MRNPSNSVALRNEHLVSKMKDIKAEPPFWGYRRVWYGQKALHGGADNKAFASGICSSLGYRPPAPQPHSIRQG